MKKRDIKKSKSEILPISEFPESGNEILSSAKDRDKFFDALMNPPLPNENLRKAYQLHQEFLRNSG